MMLAFLCVGLLVKRFSETPTNKMSQGLWTESRNLYSADTINHMTQKYVNKAVQHQNILGW
jgi:hypothetical protein